MSYTDLIVKATQCTPEEAPLVEGYMRLTYHTLDGLDARTFGREARTCLKDVRLDPAMARENAESYGLVRRQPKVAFDVLARYFSEEIRKSLTPAQLTEVNRLNDGDPDAKSGAVCHSGDFIDSNVCMIAAWVRAGGNDDNMGDAESVATCNAAWDKAKAAHFNLA